MASKYHISGDGVPRSCSAAEGNCPLGGDENHFSTQIAARTAYEARQEASTIAPSLQKKLTSKEKESARATQPKPEYETVRPTPEYEYLYESLKVSKLKAGDRMRLAKDPEAVVTAIKRGTKNAAITLRLSDGSEKTVSAPLDSDVFADVKTQTAASRAAGNLAEKELALERGLATYEPKRAKALADISVAHQKGFSLRSYSLDSLLQAEAQDEVMSIYENAVTNTKKAIAEGREGYADVKNPYTKAFETVEKEFTKDILREAERGGSKSTSAMSNLVDSEMLAAKAKFLDSIRWY